METYEERKPEEPREPYIVFRGTRGHSLTVWRNKVVTDDGRTFFKFAAKAQKTYKKDGAYKYSEYIDEENFLEIAELFRLANNERLDEHERARRERNTAVKTAEQKNATWSRPW